MNIKWRPSIIRVSQYFRLTFDCANAQSEFEGERIELTHQMMPSSDAQPGGWDGGGRRIRTFEVCDGRFTVCSLWPLGNPTYLMVPATGIELVTYWLQVSCSTNWAKPASSDAHSRKCGCRMQQKNRQICAIDYYLCKSSQINHKMQQICSIALLY